MIERNDVYHTSIILFALDVDKEVQILFNIK